MDSRQRYLEEQLQRRESEASELRRNLHELSGKFFQLERAFEINLQSQALQEVEFNRMKVEYEELRKLNVETAQARTKLNSILMNTTTERDHWKNAFLQQRGDIKREKIGWGNAMDLVKRECEDILKQTRESAEKQFHEMVELYNESREKVSLLEGQVVEYEDLKREHENRSFELANLLETLKRFDVDVGSVCQLGAEALRNLTESGNLFEGSMKNLRHLAWTVKERKDEPQLVLLREQNSVLREVVKNLKRKFQMLNQTHNEIPEKEYEERHERMLLENTTNSQNNNDKLLYESEFDKNIVPAVENSINSLIHENNNNYTKERKGHVENEMRGLTDGYKNDNRNKRFDIENTKIDQCGRILCIESHSNGTIYEEYVIKLSINREIKIKYPIVLNNNDAMVRLEFMDNEIDYEKAPIDRMLILFKNIHAVVNFKQTGVPCSTQTTKIKTSNNFTQTSFTGINSFSRINAGVTVSEKIFKFLL
ncbi:myosin-1-like isoform X1 [Apis cerana]|uniref:myosin-1-like isoform X1 n=1 Tax=Apis cerana TaxID=7461 RepID=UPI0007E2BF8C|nr:myosin-1-like isoform X1 [Apis cerana]